MTAPLWLHVLTVSAALSLYPIGAIAHEYDDPPASSGERRWADEVGGVSYAESTAEDTENPGAYADESTLADDGGFAAAETPVDEQDLSEFERAVDGYGTWEYIDGYGRAFVPSVSGGWSPYLYGCWTWTSLGWYWTSYEPWGYYPHHYGSWRWFGSRGWCWFPGSTWYRSNVHWYRSNGHIGWVPRAVRPADRHRLLNAVATKSFTSRRLYAHALTAGRVPRSLAAGLVRNAAKPSRALVERALGRALTTTRLTTHAVAGSKRLKRVVPDGRAREAAKRLGAETHPSVPRPKSYVRPVDVPRPSSRRLAPGQGSVPSTGRHARAPGPSPRRAAPAWRPPAPRPSTRPHSGRHGTYTPRPSVSRSAPTRSWSGHAPSGRSFKSHAPSRRSSGSHTGSGRASSGRRSSRHSSHRR